MEIKEMEETNTKESSPGPNPNPIPNVSPSTKAKTVRTKVPEIEIHVYRQGKGPIEVFKSSLGGWDQDQLEVREILEKYGFKSVYAFSPGGSGRGAPIRFNPRNGRSLLGYRDGSVIYIDGEPKDSLIKPVTKILFGVAVITFFITMVLKEPPQWIKNSNLFGGSFPPWILACAVIVFTRMRKRTRDFLKKHGW
ncbi:uncharacterized protein LOC8281408 [Ricinus communis]|uniref:Uncharacterized protein n=1 Tax=Ricinus communis TaxID=3988 RepID=B9SM88_RICCO|nr:uncharacterized protein LOC8281408 [Ricinus communis]EEF35270.1 conserved hypothetical protein [Ricinus communis]|eukprot:XP_002527107.1 uncharacterized protein LOC8281408 [Ricinus communis]